MAEKLKIEVFRKKDAEDLSISISDPASKAQSGSASAMSAVMAASLMKRAAALALNDNKENERLQWLDRNSEIIRKYMVQLIDEDVKCRGPLTKAIKEAGPREIEAARHPACAICEELVNMMHQTLELLLELKALSKSENVHFVKEAAIFANASIKTAQEFILDMTSYCSDDTYVFVTKRENEIVSKQCEETYLKILG